MERFSYFRYIKYFEDSKEHFEKSSAPDTSNNIFIRKFFQELISISIWRIGFSRWCPNGIKWKDLKNINISGC